MTTTTITEALAEIKTIGKRLEKKHQFVLEHLMRQDARRDPLEREGGSVAAIQTTRQAIHDLEERIVRIRRAIAKANDVIELSICGTTRTLSEWLTWRREVSAGQAQFLNGLRNQIAKTREEWARKGWGIAGETANPADTDLIINVNERELADESEKIEEILGVLDGQLSLKNATTMIEVAD